MSLPHHYQVNEPKNCSTLRQAETGCPATKEEKRRWDIPLLFSESISSSVRACRLCKCSLVHVCMCCSPSISICHQCNQSVYRRALTTCSKLAFPPFLHWFNFKKNKTKNKIPLSSCCWRLNNEDEWSTWAAGGALTRTNRFQQFKALWL